METLRDRAAEFIGTGDGSGSGCGYGCGYGVSLYRHFDEARELLKKNGLLNGKSFYRYDGGDYREIN